MDVAVVVVAATVFVIIGVLVFVNVAWGLSVAIFMVAFNVESVDGPTGIPAL